MSAAPIGAFVRIYYDGRELAVGDYLRTPSGRHYHVAGRRVQLRGGHVGRQHLLCRVSEPPPAGSRVLPLRWYKRGR